MTRTAHDALFKYVFSKPEHARGALRAVLPPSLLAQLDLSTLEEKTRELIGPTLSSRYGDLVYQAQLRDHPAFLFFLHEHQTEPRHLVLARAQVYGGRILGDWLREQPDSTTRIPAFMAVLLYPGPTRWTGPRELADLYNLPDKLRTSLRSYLPNFRLLVDELAEISDVELSDRDATPLSKLGWLLLKHDRTQDLGEAQLRSWRDLLQELERSSSVQDLEAVARYTLLRSNISPKHVERLMHDLAGERTQKVTLRAGEQLFAQALEQGREQGREQGIEQGLEQGLEQGREGKRDLVLRMFSKRFGQVPPEVSQRVQAASDPDLDLWAIRLLDASSLEDVFAGE